MRPIKRQVLGLLGASLCFTPLWVCAQGSASHAPPNTAHTKRIEGTVVRIDHNELLLKVHGGTTETYQFSPSAQLARSRPAQMSDLTAGKFVGCINLYGQSDKKVAGECSILPDGLRALVDNPEDATAAENAWVSGRIADVSNNADGPSNARSLLIKIADNGKSTTMAVTPVTRVSVVSAADASALKVGVSVRGVSQLAVDGTGVIQSLTVRSERAEGPR